MVDVLKSVNPQNRSSQASGPGKADFAVKDPAAVCGWIWYHGTDEQRKGIGSTEGRGRDEKPPGAWWDACIAKIGG